MRTLAFRFQKIALSDQPIEINLGDRMGEGSLAERLNALKINAANW